MTVRLRKGAASNGRATLILTKSDISATVGCRGATARTECDTLTGGTPDGLRHVTYDPGFRSGLERVPEGLPRRSILPLAIVACITFLLAAIAV